MRKQFKYQLIAFFLLIAVCQANGSQFQHNTDSETYSGNEYKQLQKSLANGWNTWNTKSVLSHVFLPECFAINLKLHNSETGRTLENALIGRQGSDKDLIEKIAQGSRSYDGTYTDLTIDWQGIKLRIQSAASGNNLNLLVTPVKTDEHAVLKVKPEFLWKRDGSVQISNRKISAKSADFKINIYAISQEQLAISSISDSCLNFSLSGKIGFSTDKRATIETVENTINEANNKLQTENSKHHPYANLYEPMQNVLAWNTIYEPTGNRVVSLVSQAWSEIWGGFMLPVWDTYLAAYMLSFDNKDLAYSNVLAITKSITAGGFVPNVSTGFGKTEDRSQPPVGSFVIKELYRKYHEKWLLHETFDELLSWNRWWDKNRNFDGFLCWGSTPYPNYQDNKALAYGVNELQGALYESGLDNSAMYDDVHFDKEKHVMLLADVGLMSLYVLDCNSLAEIAIEIGKPEIASELNERAAKYAENLQKLWNEKTGIFQNKHLDTGNFSENLSPTLFYPLMAGVATQKQAERMIQEHFYNPDEFWGEYIMPCTARNEKAFADNHYFRGRIWGPMNFLVYLGLRKYNIGNSTSDMAEKSKQILLKTWNLKHDVYENYSATTGEGFDVGSSQKSYYWGALLGFMSFIETSLVQATEKPIINNKTKSVSIVIAPESGNLEKFAAKEVRRYLYLRTGKLLQIVQTDWNKLPKSADVILIGNSHSAIIAHFADWAKISNPSSFLKSEEYWLKTITLKSRKILLVSGNDEVSTLHAAYKLMESYGIRFTLNGDVIPDEIVPMEIPEIDRIYLPQFAIRGMLPYHSWNPEGPENWNEDAYKSFLSQQVKMGLNFMGLIYDFANSDRRTYIFPPEKQHWGSGDYWIDTPPFGADQVFKSNLYGSDRWLEARKLPTPEEQSAYMKEANMKFMGDVFLFAHLFGIKCAIGAENRGNQAYFETLFKELGRAVKPDFFWISSPEKWSYSSPPQNTTDELISSYKAAYSARNAIKASFEIATMGWALGPQNDPLVLDRNLPKEIIMSTQNLNVGKGPVQPEWAQITGRRKWDIPWMEDDFNLLSPQLWVNRTIQNAADARKYGCEGLIGVHWRTKTITPQTMALAELGWNNQLNIKSFYDDFSRTQFGTEAADQISAIFQQIDSNLPEASQWLDMWPGGIKKDSSYWKLNKGKYDFVAQLENLRPKIVGKGNLERFDYYLNQYKYLRGLAKFKSATGQLETENCLREAMNALIQSASSVGEIGNMVCITRQFGKNMPLNYTGNPHLIVLTPRTSLLSGENLNLDVFFVENGNPQKVELYWKPLGEKAYKIQSAVRQQRNHFVVQLAAAEMADNDIEYYIKGTTSANNEVLFPATTPERANTVVLLNNEL